MNEENNESLESFANRVNVHIELNLDTKSKELFDELIENKTITKDLFDLEGIDIIIRHASFFKTFNLHIPFELIFDRSSGRGVIENDLSHNFTFIDVDVQYDEENQIATFIITFRLVLYLEDIDKFVSLFGILKCSYESANPSDQEMMDLTKHVLNNLPV